MDRLQVGTLTPETAGASRADHTSSASYVVSPRSRPVDSVSRGVLAETAPGASVCLGNGAVAFQFVDENCFFFFLFEQLSLRRTNVLEAVLPHVMRTVHQLSHFSGMGVNVIWFPPARDPGFHVWTNEPSIIFPPD